MKLKIDTSERELIKVGIDDKIYTTRSKDGASQKLLPFIDEILKKTGTSINQITEIEVNPGPGSFTGLRVGVSVANALGWALKIPVNRRKINQGETIDIVYGKK